MNSSLPPVGRDNPYRTMLSPQERARQEAEQRILDSAKFRLTANTTIVDKADDELEAVFQTLPENHKRSFIHGSLSAHTVGLHRYQGFVVYREPEHCFWIVLKNGKEWRQGRFLSDREAHKAIDKHQVFAERLATRREE